MYLWVSGSLGTIIGSVRHLMKVTFSSSASYIRSVLTFAFRFGSLQTVKVVNGGYCNTVKHVKKGQIGKWESNEVHSSLFRSAASCFHFNKSGMVSASEDSWLLPFRLVLLGWIHSMFDLRAASQTWHWCGSWGPGSRQGGTRFSVISHCYLCDTCVTLVWNIVKHCRETRIVEGLATLCRKMSQHAAMLFEFKSVVSLLVSLLMDVFSNGSMAFWNLTDFTTFKRWVMESSEWPVVSMDFGRPEVTPSWTFSWIFTGNWWWVTHHTFHTKHFKAFADFLRR